MIEILQFVNCIKEADMETIWDMVKAANQPGNKVMWVRPDVIVVYKGKGAKQQVDAAYVNYGT